MTGLDKGFKVPDTCKTVEIYPVPPEAKDNADLLSNVGLAFGGFATCPQEEQGGDNKMVIERYDTGPLSPYAKSQLEDLATSCRDINISFFS